MEIPKLDLSEAVEFNADDISIACKQHLANFGLPERFYMKLIDSPKHKGKVSKSRYDNICFMKTVHFLRKVYGKKEEET